MKKLGIDVGGTFIKLYWEDGKEKLKTPKSKEELLRLLTSILRRHSPEKVGLAIAGIIDKRELKLLESPNLPLLKGLNLKRLTESFKGELHLFNDATAAAYGEYKAGSGRGSKGLVCITLGTGLGGGAVIEGRPVEGVRGSALEPGHTCIDIEGWECSCGRRGCLEAYASSYGLERHYRELWGKKLKAAEIVKRAATGDGRAAKALERLAFYLSVGVVNLIHIFNPDRVVITGGTVARYPNLVKLTEKMVKERGFKGLTEGVKILPGELSDYSGAVGAYLLLELRET